MSEIRVRPSPFVDRDNTSPLEQSSAALSDQIDMTEHDKKTVGLDSNLNPLAPGAEEDDGPQGSGQELQKIRIFGYSVSRVVLVTHFNIFLYSSAFWIQNAVFPYLSKELGADPVVFGYLQTTFALVQLAGGPLFGRFGDLFGSRLAMMLSFWAAALTYLLLGVSTNIPLLFLSRMPSVFMHAMQAGQMIVTDVCTHKQRADALGKLGISYGVGMVIGPVAGGLLAKYFSLEKAAFAASILSVISIVLIYLYIPKTVKKVTPSGLFMQPIPWPDATWEDRELYAIVHAYGTRKVSVPRVYTAYAVCNKDKNVFDLKKIIGLMKAPGAAFLIAIKIATGIPIGIFQSMFSIVALDLFKLPPEQNSYIMSYIGVMAMIVQGVGIGMVTKKFSELGILFGSAFTLMVSYLMLSYVTTVWEMCIVFIPMTAGLTFQNVITTSALTHTVSDADTGAMLGLSMAVNSLIRSLSPTIGGYMLARYGFESFGYLGFVTSLAVTVVLYRKKNLASE